MKKMIITAALVNAFVFLLIAKVSANPVENTFNKISIWATEEKAKTIEFQKESWADGKAQIAKSWNDIKNLFNWTK